MRSMVRLVGCAAVSLAALVASGSAEAGDEAAGPSPMVGTYAGQASNAFEITSPMRRTKSRTGAETDVVAVSGKDVTITRTISGEDGKTARCILRGTLTSPTTATLSPGQTCPMPSDAAQLRAELTSGTASVTGAALKVSLRFSVSGTARGHAVQGTHTTTVNGTRR